jgi:arylsulfatase A-like enzyme
MDWSVGRLLDTLKELGLDDRTLVIWTSDNGAVRRSPMLGSNAPLGGWGYSTTEGGMRMPLIARWPGRILAGTECAELTAMMDWLPTLAALIGATLPADRVIDGRDIRPLLFGTSSEKSPHRAFDYYMFDQLQAVRAGRWKLHLPLDQTVRRCLHNLVRERYARKPGRLETALSGSQDPPLVARGPPRIVAGESVRFAEADNARAVAVSLNCFPAVQPTSAAVMRRSSSS